MMTYHGTCKTVLIISQWFNTSRREPSSWADSFERFRSLVRSLISDCVKFTSKSSSSVLCASSKATSVLSLCLASELYFMLTPDSGTGSSGPWGTGFMAEGTSGYWTCCLFLLFFSFQIYLAEIGVRNVIFPFLQTIGIAISIVFLLQFLQSPKFSTQVLQQTWRVNSLSWPPFLTHNNNHDMPSLQSQWFLFDGLGRNILRLNLSGLFLHFQYILTTIQTWSWKEGKINQPSARLR